MKEVCISFSWACIAFICIFEELFEENKCSLGIFKIN